VLILARTKRVDASGVVTYGNLYSNLLDYVVFAALMFYVLTILSVFVLRKKRPTPTARIKRSAILSCPLCTLSRPR